MDHPVDLDARPYRSFIAVAETGSFGRAAETLHISQPALSAQIKEFERRLGFALFVRSSRKVALTNEGRLFLDKARRLVIETEWVNNAARELRSNQLRIGAAHHTAGIEQRNRLIDDFMVAYPEVPVRVLRRSPMQLREDLDHNRIDVAILLDFGDAANTVGADAGVQRWTIAARAVTLAVPVGHPLADDPIVSLQALQGLPIGTVDRSHGVGIAEGVARLLIQSGALPITLPEGDAQSVIRQCARLNRCAIDLGWFALPATTVRPLSVAGWEAQTSLVVLAKRGERRNGADRFLNSLPASPTAPS